nr:MAG TPA: hypothetical protein [Caudoviricetes sp.]
MHGWARYSHGRSTWPRFEACEPMWPRSAPITRAWNSTTCARGTRFCSNRSSSR